MKKKNIYKLSQDIYDQYDSLQSQLGSVQVVGGGADRSINILGQSLPVRQILDQAISTIKPVLVQKGVHTVDTSPLPPNAQGLAVSHEPGVIHVDVEKIANKYEQSMPPTVQTDGVSVDMDSIQHILDGVRQEIMSELGGTLAHESQHVEDYRNVAENRGQFNTVQEAPGPRFEERIRKQYFVNY